ncbi:hypothetical protein F5B22DRAFT_612480 [Xylaria bambusicola]|uniref:uncharacterized protein n=1 Tax=Xylaria bambusicola TaxID=326684 RepID=UPI0020088B14|nr:uncharacterized protein F5B22DRAFT_612480 [Xylaria bambusicola]KAI0513155.1 hypothetical protein F5B22DRAFT_612480 [Xylaria bambusicola]
MNDKENTTDKLWSTLVRLYTVEEHNGVISIPMPDEPAIVLLQQICLDALRRRKGRCLESNEIYDEMKRVFKCFGCSRAWNSHIPLLPASTTIIASGKRITIETSGETWKYLTDLNRDRRDARDRRLISCSGPYREYLKYISEDICSQVEEGDSKEARASRKAYHKKLHQTPERVADKIEVPGLFLTLKPTGDFKHARFLCACRFRSKEPFASAPLPEATDNFVLYGAEKCSEVLCYLTHFGSQP